MNNSEVARLMQRIDDEYQAAWNGLSGTASGTARHDFINARFENMDHARNDLESLVGGEQASSLFTQWLENL